MDSIADLRKRVEVSVDFLRDQVKLAEEKNSRVLMTSSFQTQSVPLLHLVSLHFPDTEVLFIDTGFLFAETYRFKDQLQKLMGFKLKELRSSKGYLEQLSRDGLFLYAHDTDKCCRINKVDPLNDYLKSSDFWISGVRKDQTANRAAMAPVEMDKRGITRIHPMLDWTSRDIYNYINENNLPKHPLDLAGYESIGCVPCTHACADERSGRWEGSRKTECGLHTENR